MMCTGNTIKTTVGNTADCNEACDGVGTVPNADHGTCGILPIILSQTIRSFQHLMRAKYSRPLYFIAPNISVCAAGYNMLDDGSCSKLRKSEQFNLKQRNVKIVSDEVVIMQVKWNQMIMSIGKRSYGELKTVKLIVMLN